MQRQPIFSVQPLESRRLLAGHPGPGSAGGIGQFLDDPTIVADRQAIEDAYHQLRTDKREGMVTIRADQQAIREELKQLADDKGEEAIHDALQPLKDQLRADEKAKNKELRAAAGELRDAKREWAKTLLADLKAWRQARVDGSDQDAIDAAKQKLDDDKSAAQEALKPIRDEILAIKDKWRPIITADHEAIETKLEELNPDLEPLFDKLDDDATALNDKLTADQKAVQDALDKLKADLDALKNSATT